MYNDKGNVFPTNSPVIQFTQLMKRKVKIQKSTKTVHDSYFWEQGHFISANSYDWNGTFKGQPRATVW